MYKFLKNVIFQEVLNILYFKIIPNISPKFDSNFGGPKLTHTSYSPLMYEVWHKDLKMQCFLTCIFLIIGHVGVYYRVSVYLLLIISATKD